MKTISLVILTGVLCSTPALANVKPIPKNFYGKWVVNVEKKLTPKQITKYCRGDIEWGTLMIEFNSKSINFPAYPTGGYANAQIINYKKYTPTHIKGTYQVEGYAEADPFTETQPFEFLIAKGKLHYITYIDNEKDTTILTKCK